MTQTDLERASKILKMPGASPEQMAWALEVPGIDPEIFWKSTKERQEKEDNED